MRAWGDTLRIPGLQEKACLADEWLPVILCAWGEGRGMGESEEVKRGCGEGLRGPVLQLAITSPPLCRPSVMAAKLASGWVPPSTSYPVLLARPATTCRKADSALLPCSWGPRQGLPWLSSTRGK